MIRFNPKMPVAFENNKALTGRNRKTASARSLHKFPEKVIERTQRITASGM